MVYFHYHLWIRYSGRPFVVLFVPIPPPVVFFAILLFSSHLIRFSYYYYLFIEMGSYPAFWLSLGLTNVVALAPVFMMKWWLMQ